MRTHKDFNGTIDNLCVVEINTSSSYKRRYRVTCDARHDGEKQWHAISFDFYSSKRITDIDDVLPDILIHINPKGTTNDRTIKRD